MDTIEFKNAVIRIGKDIIHIYLNTTKAVLDKDIILAEGVIEINDGQWSVYGSRMLFHIEKKLGFQSPKWAEKKQQKFLRDKVCCFFVEEVTRPLNKNWRNWWQGEDKTYLRPKEDKPMRLKEVDDFRLEILKGYDVKLLRGINAPD